MIPRTLLRSHNGSTRRASLYFDRFIAAAASDGTASTSNANTTNVLRLYRSSNPVLSSRLPWMAGSNHVGSVFYYNRRDNTFDDSPPYSFSFVKLLPDEQDRQQPTHMLSPYSDASYRMFSTSTAPNSDEKDDNNEKQQVQQPEKVTFPSMMRKYGPLFITTYLTVYVSTVFGIYLGITSGALDPAYLLSFITGNGGADGAADPDAAQTAANSVEVIKEFLNKYPWTQPAVPFVEKYPWAANLGVAWVVTKPTEPIRFGVTVGLVPLLARTLGYNTPKTNTAKEPLSVETKKQDEQSS